MLPIPFNIHVDPMERLLLVNIEMDPDSVYVGFEPQVFDDDVNGRGHLVIGWRADGRVDVFHQPGLRLDPGKYDIAGKGLANMAVRDMQGCSFEVDERGVQAGYSFEDLRGRRVELVVHEGSSRKRRPFGLLAPMGEAAEAPSALPLFMLHDFYFVRQTGTDISLVIGGRSHRPDILPFPLDWSRMYFARYSPDPLIVTLNPAFEGTLPMLEVNREASITAGNTAYEVELHQGAPVLRAIERWHGKHVVRIAFEPAFPNLLAFSGQREWAGEFTFTGHISMGEVRGRYIVEQLDSEAKIVMVPSGGWVPNPSSLSLHILYRVARVFRDWPKSYRWTARAVAADSGSLHMHSWWERTLTRQ